VSAGSVDGASAVFAALADDTRRTVLQAVVRAGPTTATEVATTVPVTRQAVAKHLGVLREAGLVQSARVGRETRYEARPDALAPALEWIRATDAAWSERLARLKGQAEGASRADPAEH
jgi:DNA-binding transcriptional ArsR family regulator